MALGLLLLIAVLQGVTEFLPVSSSGHLTFAAEVFDLRVHGPTREALFVLLHFASLLATCWWLRADLRALCTDRTRRGEVLAIFLGALPAAVAGLTWKFFGTGDLFGSLWLVGIGWLLSAGVLLATRWRVRETWTLRGRLPIAALLAIGSAQALAIVPGVTRSGATIAVALLCGMTRVEAFRFSFLISLPVILGATLLDVGAMAHVADVAGPLPLAGAFVVCLAVSLGALAVLQRVVLAKRLHWFAPYCFAAAIVAFVLAR